MFQEKFLIAENPQSMPGPGMVISTRPPYFVGKVIQFKTDEELNEFRERSTPGRYFPCEGYRIGVYVISSLADRTEEQANPTLDFGKEMADYYLQSKILRSASYYKKYKE